MRLRTRTVPEAVRSVIARRPVHIVITWPPTRTVRRVRDLRPLPQRPPTVHPAVSELAGTVGISGWRRAGRPTPPRSPVVRLPPLWAAGAMLALLFAGAAAAGGILTGAGAGAGTGPLNPEDATRSLQHRPAPLSDDSNDSTAPRPDRPPPTGAIGERAWPVAGTAGARPTIARGWEPPPAPWAPGHRGVDLLATANATVRAAAPGRVLFAGQVAGRGVLSIEVSGSGTPPLRTTYEPVRPTVRKGDHVTAGQPVATLGPGPFHCSAPCLHWGLLRGKTYLDPLSLLPPSMWHSAPSRLLPVTAVPEPAGGAERRMRNPMPIWSRLTPRLSPGTPVKGDRERGRSWPATVNPGPEADQPTNHSAPYTPISLLRRPGPWRPQPP